MEEDAFGCSRGFGLGGSGASIDGVCCLQEEGLELGGAVASVEQVSVEGFGGGHVVSTVTVLQPESVEVSKDEAFQHSLGVG